jgi:dGTPase
MSNNEFDRLLKLVKQDRLRLSTRRGELIESESDKARVINSPAFRRLQQKAQVFPLDPNAAVRTRLTHSIEVSQVGRHLAQKVIKKVGYEEGNYEKLSAFVNNIESACLLHDIATVSGCFIGMPTTMASTGPHRAPGRLVCENSA